jgi:hypothetical protein
MSTYSTNLALELIGNGEQAGNWGQTTNTNLGTLLEQAISGYVTQAITDGADTTLTMTQGASATARNMTIELTGTLTAARNLIVPSNKKLYFIYNNTSGGFAVTVKVSGQTGVSVPNGSKLILTCNGTDIVNATSYVTSAGGGGTVTSVNVSGGSTGLSFSGGPVTTSGTITMSGTLSTSNGGTGSSSLAGAGIITTGGGQTIGGGLTVTGTSNLTGDVNLGASTKYITLNGQLRLLTSGAGAAFGTNSPNGTYALYVEGVSGWSGGLVTQSNSSTVGAICATSNTSLAIIQFNYGTLASAVNVGGIGTNGTSTGYNTTSDYRLKENIVPLVNATTRIKLLKPCNFNWKSAPEKGVTEGFIAHELAEVVPDAVQGEKDALDKDGNPKYQGVDSSFLIPMLTAALQEALARIEALEAKVG